MSTPAQEQQRAVALADTAVNALTAARSSLINAAAVTDEVNAQLRRTENDIAELPGQATRVRIADEPQPFLRNAQGIAEDIDGRLRGSRRGVDEVRDHLQQSGRAVRAGRESLAELAQLPGQQNTQAMDRLWTRLNGLDRAVQGATEGVEETSRRLGRARENLRPLLESSSYVDDRQRTAAMISEAGRSVDTDVMAVRGGLRTLREGLDNSQPDANIAAADSADLANAVRAGMNPTPASAQTAPGALGEDPRIAWAEGRDMGQGIDR